MFNPPDARAPQRRAWAILGGGKGTRRKTESDKMSFSEDTSAKTGKSKRTVERDAAVGAKLDDKAVAKLQGHAVANNKTELAKLAAMPAKEQREVAAKLARRKEIYEALHPESKHGGAGKGDQNRVDKMATLTAWGAAGKLGQDPRLTDKQLRDTITA